MDGILQSLYTVDGSKQAINWLWENKTQLTSNLSVAVPVAAYAASYAVMNLAPLAVTEEGYATTAEQAEFIGLATEVCEDNGHVFSDSTQGPLGSKLLVTALLSLAQTLLAEWLSQQT